MILDNSLVENTPLYKGFFEFWTKNVISPGRPLFEIQNKTFQHAKTGQSLSQTGQSLSQTDQFVGFKALEDSNWGFYLRAQLDNSIPSL